MSVTAFWAVSIFVIFAAVAAFGAYALIDTRGQPLWMAIFVFGSLASLVLPLVTVLLHRSGNRT